MSEAAILKTPLHALHFALGARMGPFAGYDMPIQYPQGILAEHLHTRRSAGLFDVSHMGQAELVARDHQTAARALECLCPLDALGLPPGRQRYTQLLNDDGGTIDDLMVSRMPDADGRLDLVFNASRKAIDAAHIRARLPHGVELVEHPEAALIALQGPKAVDVLMRLAPETDLRAMPFMTTTMTRISGLKTRVSRSGYTGEDGFEISLPAAGAAEIFAGRLLEEPEVAPIGLGARDSLRLEAGLCLYGHELDETIDPIEAGLAWSIPKRRRLEGGFLGSARVQAALAAGASRKRVGVKLDGRAPAREGAEVIAAGRSVGRVTSGGYGPSVKGAIAMAFVEAAQASLGTEVEIIVRGRPLPGRVTSLPFHPHTYRRGS